jgi:hydrogenase maturation protease
MVSQTKAGRTVRFDALTEKIPVELFAGYSTHSINIVTAIQLATVLGRLPRRLLVYGIEGEDLSFGEGLSPAVQKAAVTVAQDIVVELCGHSAPDPGRRHTDA